MRRLLVLLLSCCLLGGWSQGGNLNFYNDGASMAPQIYTGSAGIYAPSDQNKLVILGRLAARSRHIAACGQSDNV